MATERPNPESRLQIGEMPKPRYMREAWNTSVDSDGTPIRWIGMEAYSPDGEIKEFHWWRNFKVGNLNDEQARHDSAAFIARLKLEMGADSAIGLPVDLSKSNSETGHLEVVTDDPEVYGVYVEADKRPMFNFMTMMQGVKSEAELRRARPVEFDEILQKAKAVLPRPENPDSSQEQPSFIGKEVMEDLKEHIGHSVTVEHVWYGIPHTESSKNLRSVNDFTNIEIEGSGIPFVGYGSAIRRITGANGEVLYNNPHVTEDYDRRANQEVDEMVRLTFGEEVADAKIREREEYDRDWQERQARANAEAQVRSVSIIEDGEQYVKEELKDEWREYAQKNTQDGYSGAVVEASNKVSKALSEGKTLEEAEKAMDDEGLTGFQAGCVAQAISHFHPRGDEFRQWWNRQYLSEEQAEEAKGVVNPAILTISPKES